MPIMEGWEVSPDVIDFYQEILTEYAIGDTIITSKCKLNNDSGLLVVSDNGFAWKIKPGGTTSFYNYGKKKWIRWHDVQNITPKKNGQVLVEIKIRKTGKLIVDKKGIPKITKWKLTIIPNKKEDKNQWKKREESFNDLLLKIYNQYKSVTDPPVSDSVM